MRLGCVRFPFFNPRNRLIRVHPRFRQSVPVTPPVLSYHLADEIHVMRFIILLWTTSILSVLTLQINMVRMLPYFAPTCQLRLRYFRHRNKLKTSKENITT